MGEVKLRISSLLAATSALVCLYLLALMLQSPWGFDSDFQHSFQRGDSTYFIGSRVGRLWLVKQDVSYNASPGFVAHGHRLGFVTLEVDRGVTGTERIGPDPPTSSFLGFGATARQGSKTWSLRREKIVGLTASYSSAVLTIPYWFILLPTIVFPLVWVRGFIRNRRRRLRGKCLACGYDLRAHNAGDRCPECGMVLSPAR